MSKMPAVGRIRLPSRADFGIECELLGNRLRRASLLPATAGTLAVAPVGEPYAFASLSPDLLLRVARDTGRGDDAGGLLCRKGQASASRWRSYDHKDVFEPAQAATAPPSDAEEMGSWQKYDSAPPAPKDQVKTVSDEEQPTSWFKYETKPIASLLGSMESRRAKSQVALAESAAPAPPAVFTAPAVVEAAPEADYPRAPVAPEPTIVAEVPVIQVKPASVAETEIEAPTSTADLSVEVAPATETAAAAEPATAAVPEVPLLEIDAPDLAAAVAEDDEPNLPTTVAPAPADLERSEPAVPPEDPTSALAPSDEQGPTLTEASAPEPLAIATDEPWSDEPAMGPDATEFADPTRDAAHEEPSVASAAPEPADDAAPVAPEKPAAAEAAIKSPVPGKKAMLARLAEMLEQALSTKRSQTVEVVAPQDNRGHGDEIETAADASIETPASARAEPEPTSSIIDERPIETEVPLAATPGPDVEFSAEPLDAIEISEPPAVLEAPSAELSPTPAPLEASDEIVPPADKLGRTDERETDSETPVVAAVETDPAADPVDQTEQHAPQRDLAPKVVEVKRPDSVRKATLARLAEMLERALSTKPPKAATKPSTPPEPTSMVASSITQGVAPMAMEAQTPGPAERPVEPMAMEVPLALLTPAEFAGPASVVDDATLPEPADVTGEPHTGATVALRESSGLEADLDLESVPQAPRLHEPVHIEAFDEPETAVAYEASRDETATTLALSGEAAGPPTDSGDLTTLDEHAATAVSSLEDGAAAADAPTEPTLEAVADLAPTEMRPESDDRVIAAESVEAVTLDNISTPVEETSTQPVATTLDAETAAPGDERQSVRAPALSLEATSVAPEPAALEAEIFHTIDAPALAASSSMIEAPIVVAPEISAEPIVDTVAPLETAPPEQAHEVFDPISAPTPTLDATPVARKCEDPGPEISEAVAPSAFAAPDPTIEISEPIVIAAPISAERIVGVTAPLETTQLEGEPDASEPVPVPAASLDAAPIAPEPSAPEPEISDAVDLSAPIQTAEAPAPIIIAAEPIDGAAAAVVTAAVQTSPAPEAVPDTADPPPLTPAEQEKATRLALTDDLADVIHNVLSTTQFASRAMKPKRYTEEEPGTDEPELTDIVEELTASLPHPVAIPPRFGRMERGIAFVSVAMMLAVGYFAFSLWQGAGSPAAQASARVPATAVAAPHSEDWGERARDMTRGLNPIAVIRDAPSAQGSGPAADAGTRSQGPESAQ